MANVKLTMLITVLYFRLNSFLNTMKIPMPISPPRVLVITSVISLAPIENINCKTSKVRLTKKQAKVSEEKIYFLI